MTPDMDIYSSPLSERYASRAMLELWSPRRRFGLWRQLWVALAEAGGDGLAVPDRVRRGFLAGHDSSCWLVGWIAVRGIVGS